MGDEALRVEFKVQVPKRRPEPAPAPVDRAERQRIDRVARRARNLALAYWIDHLVRSGQAADLAAVARMCGVSRARVTAVVGLLGIAEAARERVITSGPTVLRLSRHSRMAPANPIFCPLESLPRAP